MTGKNRTAAPMADITRRRIGALTLIAALTAPMAALAATVDNDMPAGPGVATANTCPEGGEWSGHQSTDGDYTWGTVTDHPDGIEVTVNEGWAVWVCVKAGADRIGYRLEGGETAVLGSPTLDGYSHWSYTASTTTTISAPEETNPTNPTNPTIPENTWPDTSITSPSTTTPTDGSTTSSTTTTPTTTPTTDTSSPTSGPDTQPEPEPVSTTTAGAGKSGTPSTLPHTGAGGMAGGLAGLVMAGIGLVGVGAAIARGKGKQDE